MNELGLESKIQVSLSRIGTTNGAKPPEFEAPEGNNDPERYTYLHKLTYEMFVADILASAADKRKKSARKACEDEGMFEPAKTIKAGTSGIIHDTPHLVMVCEKKNPAIRLDSTVLKNELNRRYGAEVANEIIELATKENAPATSYKISMK